MWLDGSKWTCTELTFFPLNMMLGHRIPYFNKYILVFHMDSSADQLDLSV